MAYEINNYSHFIDSKIECFVPNTLNSFLFCLFQLLQTKKEQQKFLMVKNGFFILLIF